MKAFVVIIALAANIVFVACSKDKGGGSAVAQPAATTANPYSAYNTGVGQQYCGQGQIPAIPYSNYHYGQPIQNVNCIQSHYIQNINPYFVRYNIGFNLVQFAGTCDLRLQGQLCPSGYTCRPMGWGPQGICSGGMYY